jgi:hypothetical protein
LEYSVFHATRIGESHIKKDIPCEDYSFSYEDDKLSIIAIADGHGDPNCFRSKEGSRFACESAIESLREFCTNVDVGELLAENSIPVEKQRIRKQLIDAILGKWYMKVEANLIESPFSPEDLNGISAKQKERFERGERVETAFGSTLICVALMDSYCIGIQIGDGTCIMISYNDCEVSSPIPEDLECFHNITTSICDKDAADKFRCFVQKELPVAVFAGSDGIDDSFSNEEELYAKYRDILIMFGDCGYDKSVKEIEEYLPVITKKGSGDDVSIAGIVNLKDAEKCKDLLELQQKEFSLSQEYKRLKD